MNHTERLKRTTTWNYEIYYRMRRFGYRNKYVTDYIDSGIKYLMIHNRAVRDG